MVASDIFPDPAVPAVVREMHDSVARHLTVIVALSDSPLARGHPLSGLGLRRDQGVSGTAPEALAQTRCLLGIMRTEGG